MSAPSAATVADAGEPARLGPRALAARSANFAFLNTLAAALYRAGRYRDSVARFTWSAHVQERGGTAALSLDFTLLPPPAGSGFR